MFIARRGSILLLSFFLTSCGGYAARVYPPVQVPDALTKVSSSTNFVVADKKSFASASVPYPTRSNRSNHTIPVGDYLLSRVILTLPRKSVV